MRFLRYTAHQQLNKKAGMSASTPIAHSKTAALARILDNVPKGYHRYTHGTVAASKAEALAKKFHALYGIGCSPAQRQTRKRKGQANTVLVMYWPLAAEKVEWLLLATDGEGLDQETLHDVGDKPYLKWLGYELVRQPSRGRAAWTWRRSKQEMEELHALIAMQANRKITTAITETLERIARQPGFHGVRTQSWALCEAALQRGYDGPLPHLFFVQKISHGERLVVE
ncbi:hypothetical protein VI06_04980 [Aquitalea magnusonii]|nr:hypothetical protein VI06_04980 [Aquitalea magnusonii]